MSITPNNTEDLPSDLELQQHENYAEPQAEGGEDEHEQQPAEEEQEAEQQHLQHQQQLTHDDDHCFSSLETHVTRRSHSSNNSNSECNLKALERRYHSLYLKSFEISVLLENLLKNDDLQVSHSQTHKSTRKSITALELRRISLFAMVN